MTRLRRRRERSGITLDAVARDTRIARDMLDAFEQNDVSGWPRGLYARAWVRAYASAIGHDPIDTVDEFCRLFPHGDRRAASTMAGIAAIVAAPAQYRDDFAHLSPVDRRQGPGARVNLLPRPTFRDRLARAARALGALLIQIPSFHRAQYRQRQ
ncbi:MAG: helix-turn-helix domain-containing protein [Vicinamibacterales bacterium]